MWTDTKSYLSARRCRTRKAIICSICAGLVVALVSESLVHVILSSTTIGIITWWYYTRTIERYHLTHPHFGDKQ